MQSYLDVGLLRKICSRCLNCGGLGVNLMLAAKNFWTLHLRSLSVLECHFEEAAVAQDPSLGNCDAYFYDGSCYCFQAGDLLKHQEEYIFRMLLK